MDAFVPPGHPDPLSQTPGIFRERYPGGVRIPGRSVPRASKGGTKTPGEFILSKTWWGRGGDIGANRHLSSYVSHREAWRTCGDVPARPFVQFFKMTKTCSAETRRGARLGERMPGIHGQIGNQVSQDVGRGKQRLASLYATSASRCVVFSLHPRGRNGLVHHEARVKARGEGGRGQVPVHVRCRLQARWLSRTSAPKAETLPTTTPDAFLVAFHASTRETSSFPRFRRAFVVQVRGPPPVRKCHVPRGFDTDHVSELLTNTCRIATSKEEARARATKEASETTTRTPGGRMEGGDARARPSTSLEAAGNEAMVQVGRHGATCRRRKLSRAWTKVPNARQLCLFVLQQGVDRTRAMLVRTIQRVQSTAPVVVVDLAKRPSVRLVLWCACTYAAGRIVLEVMTWSRNVLEVMRARRKLEWEMAQAVDFGTWAKAAAALDALRGPGREEEEDFYDQGLLKERLEHLQRVRQEGNVNEMAFALRCDQPRNLGNITNKAIHETRRVGVPETIREYIEEVKMQLKYLTNYPLPDVTPDEKLQFLAETRHGHGRTALVLSGGGALGVFHLGVVHALLQKGLLPRIMAGSSVGALICAIVATKTDAELEGTFNSGALTQMELTFFKHSGTTSLLKQMMKTGTLQDHSYFQEQLRSILGDYTFQEAYDHSGRILNISVSPTSIKEPCRVLNYLTAPHVLIWSAVAASSAFPGLFPSTVLMAKAIDGRFVEYTPEAGRGEERMWRDGSLRVDLPMRTLSELFNVNYFIVSQTNPHITPFLRLKRRLNWLRVPFASTVFRLLELEWKHRCKQLRFLIPRSFRGIQWLFTLGSQDWEGDVTIVMPTTWRQYAKIVYNPTREELSETMLQGMRATWEKLSAIEANCGIELTLDECMQSLKHEKMEVRRRRKPRIPSWFTFSGTLGHALSHDSGSEDGDP